MRESIIPSYETGKETALNIMEKVNEIGLDNLAKKPFGELKDKLIELGLFEDEYSMKMFLIFEGISAVHKDDYESPINIKLLEGDLRQEETLYGEELDRE